jgi:hypothetical protein
MDDEPMTQTMLCNSAAKLMKVTQANKYFSMHRTFPHISSHPRTSLRAFGNITIGCPTHQLTPQVQILIAQHKVDRILKKMNRNRQS